MEKLEKRILAYMSERFDKFKRFVKKYFWDVVVFIILMVMNRATPLRGLAVFAMIESACYLLKYLCIKFLYREGFNDEEIDDIFSGKWKEKDSEDSDKDDKNKV